MDNWNGSTGNNEWERRYEKMKLYCCQEHVDMALDEVVYECETYPVLTLVPEENQLSTTCEYCRNVAIYLVGN